MDDDERDTDGCDHKGDSETEEHATDKYDEDAGSDSMSKYPWEAFIIDFETSGFGGIYIAHPRNCIVQVCCMHLRSGLVFESICKPFREFKIAQESVDCHGITQERIDKEGHPLDLVMRKLMQHRGGSGEEWGEVGLGVVL